MCLPSATLTSLSLREASASVPRARAQHAHYPSALALVGPVDSSRHISFKWQLWLFTNLCSNCPVNIRLTQQLTCHIPLEFLSYLSTYPSTHPSSPEDMFIGCREKGGEEQRERGEGNREREKHQWVACRTRPDWRLNSQPPWCI